MKNFESGFGFFRDYPWPQWLGEKNRKVEDFLDNAEKLYDKKTPWHFRAKNYMGEFNIKFSTYARVHETSLRVSNPIFDLTLKT